MDVYTVQIVQGVSQAWVVLILYRYDNAILENDDYFDVLLLLFIS